MERIKRFLKSIKVFKNFWKYLAKKDLTILETRSGIKYFARGKTADKGIILEVFYDNAYLPKIEGFKIEKDDIVIDVGAQIGVFSILAAKSFEAKVFSFEPLKENYDILLKNIKINHLKNITPVKKAICRKNGTAKLYIDEENTGGHSIFFKKNKHEIIECITLKDVFNNFKIKKCDFLKLDCEGCEYDVIITTPYEILKKIDKISMEFHEHTKYKIKKLKEKLQECGFNIKIKNQMLYAWK